VTDVPLGKLAEHVEPQLIPAGLLVTVPVPVPASVTASGTGGTVVVVNVAETVVFPEMVMLQLAVPPHAPPQPVKLIPEAAVAVSDTLVPDAKTAEHVPPQSIPDGELVMVPLPLGWMTS
jgi:hypothetical protein